MNPGQSVKDRAALFIIEDAVSEGHAAAGRHHRRGHRRQYRHRPRRRRQCHGLQDGDRHPGDPEPGEEGHAAPARRRARRGAGGALQEPQQLREIFRPARRAAVPRRARTAPSGPTSSTTSPTAAAHIETTAAGDLAARPTARSTASSAPSARAARWAASATALKATQPEHRRSRIADPHGRRPLQLLHDGRARRPKAPRSPRASARAASPRTSKARSSTTPTRSRIAKRIPIVFDLLEHEGLCIGGSTGINVAGAIRLAKRDRARPHHRDACSATTAPATSPRLFNPAFLREKGLPVPPWLERRRSNLPAVFEEVPS